MRILIIGGSGRTGKLTTEELLHRGHKVTALVRNLSAMEDMPAGLDTIKGEDDFTKNATAVG
ncbi:hypothetical protein N7510_000164 [Penicillium lagena]|uniref:uncharacterized protein n=1 Tax=Penicillium lagena TaxID=94218 RepID=UPI00253FDE48|nr:uncharacterized protein N7510_000164 [Penicillium lagena]KAJ5623855.1 hypothetical protein N7510_000164 [Penicillium lagena]